MAEPTGEWLANLETGNASELGTAQVEAGNSLTAIADAAAHGVYGARCLFGGTNNDCYAWSSFTATGTDCCRLYFRFNADFSCPDTTGLYLLGFRSGTSWRYYIQFRVVSGAITIYRLYYYTESGVAFISAGNVAVTKGDWHYVEVDVLATASGTGVSDGVIRYYFDNDDERTGWWKSDVANYGVTFDRIYSGMSGTVVPTSGSYVDIDDVKRDSSHIGAYAEPSDNVVVGAALDIAVTLGAPTIDQPDNTVVGYPINISVTLGAPAIAQAAPTLVIDHTAVAKYQLIPESYKTAIKQKWLSVPGESHSEGYRVGLDLLEALDASFAVNVTESGTPEMPTSDHLRASRATWGNIDNPTGWIYYYGEEDWWTSALAITRTKAFIQYAHDNGFGLSAVGLGWCWDATWHNDPTVTKDPVYKCGWAGSSVGGPEGDLPWGLDAEDSAITGNSICLDTYLDATQQYVDYCEEHSIPTKVFFNTGAIDNLANTEHSYQRYLKYERIRDYVNTYGGVLFDYADILCWDDAGNERITSWTDGEGTVHYMPHIATDNMLNLDGSSGAANSYHIGERGALRLGKAIWVMLAMMDGWDGETPDNHLTGVSIPLATTLGSPSLNQSTPLTGSSINLNLTLGSPSLNQTTPLTGSSINLNLILGMPVLDQGKNNVIGRSISLNITLGLPSIEQEFIITPNPLGLSLNIGTPALEQEFSLRGLGNTLQLTLGSPSLEQVDNTLTGATITLNTSLGSLAINQIDNSLTGLPNEITLHLASAILDAVDNSLVGAPIEVNLSLSSPIVNPDREEIPITHYQVVSPGKIKIRIPKGAKTGRIVIHTTSGTVISNEDFIIV